METLGWIGSILLASCALPEVYYSWKTKNSGLSWAFLALWGFGEIFVFIPVLFKIKSPFLIMNYALNIVFISVICYYKYQAYKEMERRKRKYFNTYQDRTNDI